ncbi:hypothetical protein MPNT_10027 [Candidatus Methylacidithermus pantelleriae]|uniref:Uncharacterized protein n=1 Tax=Candidatus Methylacidithermus pantelleriae TaxID=2744239 RepID=A0A8J2BJW3_9BACT|nr:hypothetical protein MPNT_10027 [Candidatus Methylacidithermus pantelleriae]
MHLTAHKLATVLARFSCKKILLPSLGAFPTVSLGLLAGSAKKIPCLLVRSWAPGEAHVSQRPKPFPPSKFLAFLFLSGPPNEVFQPVG